MYEAQQRDVVDMEWFEAYRQQQGGDSFTTTDEESSSEEYESEVTEASSCDNAFYGEDVASWEEVISHNVREAEAPEEEDDMTRLREAREFCETMVPSLHLSDYEKEHMHCPSEPVMMYRPPSSQPRIPTGEAEEEQQFKKVFTIGSKKRATGKAIILNYMIENYVNVTYFFNGLTGERCDFNLVSLAKCLIRYCVEYSCKKFAKVNLRYLHALSHLLYRASVLVETGSDNQATSLRMLAHTTRLLREECGYPHLCIMSRVCQNIVLTGHLNCPIDLEVLAAHFHDATYNKAEFAGVILKLTDLERWFANRGEPTEFDLAQPYLEEDNEAASIAAINATVIPCPTGGPLGAETQRELERALRMTDEFEKLLPKKLQKGTALIFRYVATSHENLHNLTFSVKGRSFARGVSRRRRRTVASSSSTSCWRRVGASIRGEPTPHNRGGIRDATAPCLPHGV
jgi:hypothetical protein